jgi:DNA-binding NarL/FixJ family response regulator
MTVLSEDHRVDVVGIVGNGQEAVDLAFELQPDMILMDLKMPVLKRVRGNPTNQGHRLRCSNPDSPRDEGFGSQDASAAAANGYLRKEEAWPS